MRNLIFLAVVVLAVIVLAHGFPVLGPVLAVIAVTPTYFIPEVGLNGGQRRRATLTITGLTASDNTVPHGLPYTPSRISLRPGKDGTTPGGWSETSAADATNIYITVNTNGSTLGKVDVIE